MRLFKVTTATGQVVYVYATSNAEAQRLAGEFSSSFSQAATPVEVPVGSSEAGTIGTPVLIQQNGRVVPLGAISATSPLLAFAALGGGSRSPEQIITDFGSIVPQEERATSPAANRIGELGARPGDPFTATDPIEFPRGFGVAFRNRLDQEGLGGLRGVGRSLESPLADLFSTGIGTPVGTTGGLFGTQENRENFAAEDFISRALGGLRGGGRTLGSIASSIFGAPVTDVNQQFFNPQFDTPQALRAAETGAEVARLAARQQFGSSFANLLPSRFDLVEQFRAQPTGEAIPDFREFLSRRTQRGFIS